MIIIKKIEISIIAIIIVFLGAIFFKTNNLTQNISKIKIEKMQETNSEEIVKEFEVSEINNWKQEFNLPKYDENGKAIIYKVDEKEVPKGYKKSIKETTITNTLIDYNKATITINHIDKTTGEILETEEKSGIEKEQIITKAIDIPLYKIIEKPEKEEYILSKEPQTVNYYYIRISEGVIEKHIDSITNKLLEDEIIHEGYEGDKYSTKEKEFKNYKLDESRIPKNKEGTFTKDPIEVNYYYIPKAGNVTINYIDQTTNKKITNSDTISGWIGEKYETSPKQFKEYDIVQKNPENRSGTMKSEEIEVNYYYIYKSKIVTEYIDKDTGKILKQDTKNGHQNDKIRTNEIEIPYYKLEEKPEKEEYILTRNPLKVVYKYRKLKFNIKVEQIIEKIIINEKQNTVNETLYKLEVPKKQTQNNIQTYYKIKVTNNSEIEGNTELNNYIPDGYQALDENNPEWNINKNKAILHVQNLKVGETREYTLVLTNTDKSKIGTIKNLVTAENSNNEAGFSEITLEDNQATTEFIINISTGLENNTKEMLQLILIRLVEMSIILIITMYIRNKRKYQDN